HTFTKTLRPTPIPTIPPIEKWTVLSLKQELISCDAQFSRRFNKVELYNLYVTLQSSNLTPKSTAASRQPTERAKLTRPETRLARVAAASLQQAWAAPQISPLQGPASALFLCTALPAATPLAIGPSDPPPASESLPPATNNPFLFQWPPVPVRDVTITGLTINHDKIPH
ncbi:hypothetical protein M9458_053374, partial [Cirrhinus mrigala]